MRAIEVKKVEDIHAVWVAGEYTGLQYTKAEMNLMLDDLASNSRSGNSRNDILAELIQRTLARADKYFEDGPLTPDEIREIIRLVAKSCKRGWF